MSTYRSYKFRPVCLAGLIAACLVVLFSKHSQAACDGFSTPNPNIARVWSNWVGHFLELATTHKLESRKQLLNTLSAEAKRLQVKIGNVDANQLGALRERFGLSAAFSDEAVRQFVSNEIQRHRSFVDRETLGIQMLLSTLKDLSPEELTKLLALNNLSAAELESSSESTLKEKLVLLRSILFYSKDRGCCGDSCTGCLFNQPTKRIISILTKSNSYDQRPNINVTNPFLDEFSAYKTKLREAGITLSVLPPFPWEMKNEE